MARPRSNKLNNKGKGTPFGKQSDAEKSFRKRPRPSAGKFGSESPFKKSDKDNVDRPRPARFGNDQGSRKRYSSSDKGPFEKKPGGFKSDKPRFSDSNRGDRGKPRFNSSEGGGRDKPRFTGPPRFAGADRKEKPFGKRDRDDSGFSKGPFKKDDSGFKRPYKKDSAPKDDRAPRFPKADKEDRVEKPERKSFIQSRVIRSGEFTKTIRNQGPKTTSSKDAAPRETETQQDGLTRLNKYIANSGVGSRREADELIKMGLIKVNGTTVTTLGTKVKPGDEIRYEDRVLKAEKPVYILLNKPKGFITTTEDPQERNTVMGLVAGACKERIYPVGRLDRNTTGLLLLTNDGDLADKLTHPSYKAKKVYKVELDRPLTKADFQKVLDGVQLEEGRAMVDDCAIISEDNKTVGLEIHIGWNRVVRRIFESLGYIVSKLDRSVFAGLDKKDLSRGQWRFLKPEEVVRLKHFK